MVGGGWAALVVVELFDGMTYVKDMCRGDTGSLGHGR